MIQLAISLAFGYIYDIVGRRMTVFFSVALGAISTIFIPYTAPSIVTLICVRIGIITTLSALGSHPFVNDYVKKETRGRAIAF